MTDVPRTILDVTREIWEDRRVHSLRGSYAPGLVVRSPAGVVQGNEGIVAATLATLAEFPDRALMGEDVIWCETPAGTLSSHRLICTATHAGPGAYGAPTGRRLRYRILADCALEGRQITDEWLVRDQGAIVRQMGRDPWDWTREAIARDGGPERCTRPFTPERDVLGPYSGHGNGHALGTELAGALKRLASGDVAAIGATWDRAAELHYPSHAETHGHEAAARFWLGLRAALPDARFTVHHAIGRDDPLCPPRAAVRWSLDGRHAGPGAFGPASGAAVHVMGITHAEFGPRGLRREWTLIDETAVLRQILLATGAV